MPAYGPLVLMNAHSLDIGGGSCRSVVHGIPQIVDTMWIPSFLRLAGPIDPTQPQF